ncbi:hypothetical protein SEA_CRAZYRICH_55 [Microbacterium phage CrazyRich]|nr:hypothetical protein SEA_CRAZYRICH_55 [Microbacterium phage CrazyRich]
MENRDLSRLMVEAARRATEVCLSKGYNRGDKVTIDSARKAAEEVYRRERPEDWAPKPTAPADDSWRDRADVGG